MALFLRYAEYSICPLALKEMNQRLADIAGLRNEIHAFPQIAFIVSITASDRHWASPTQDARVLVFFECTFGVEDLESGDTLHGARTRAQGAVTVPKRMRQGAETSLLADFLDHFFEGVRNNRFLEK